MNITRAAASSLALASAAALLSAAPAGANPPRNDFGSAQGSVDGSILAIAPDRDELLAAMSSTPAMRGTVLGWIACQLGTLGRQTTGAQTTGGVTADGVSADGCMLPSLSPGSLGS